MRGYRVALTWCVLAILGCPRPWPSQSPTSPLVNVVPSIDPSVNLAKLPSSLVYVRAYCQRSAQPDVKGTAFVVGHDDGWAYLVSARHVLFPKECGNQLVQRVQLRGEGVRDFDGEAQPIIHLQTRPEDDLVLLRARGDNRTPAVDLGVLNTDMLGNDADPIEAFGFSMLQGSGALPLHETRRGSVSKSLRDDTYREVLVTGAKLLPSMSGGPVALRSSGLVVGVVLGEYEAQKGSSREGRIAPLAPLFDMLPEALRQQLGIVLHFPVGASYQPDKPKLTWVERPELAKVLAILDAAKPGMEPARVLLHGIGGVGKTTLAFQVAALRQSRFHGGIIKIDFGDRLMDEVLSDLIEALSGQRPRSERDKPKILRALLSQRAHTLVILDNARLDEEPWNHVETVKTLLSSLAPASVLMTSRDRHAPVGFVPVEVRSLPATQAADLVTGLCHQKDRAVTAAEARELAVLLGGLPFSIERAVEMMHDDNLSAGSLAIKLRTEGRDPEGRLAKLFEWSYESLPAEAREVLIAMGQLADAPVPESLLAGLLQHGNTARGLTRLIRSGILQRQEDQPGKFVYHLHTLVWEWARGLGMERNEQLASTIRQRMLESLKTKDPTLSPLLLAHLLLAQRQAVKQHQPERVVALALGLDHALRTFGHWAALKELLTRAALAAHTLTDGRLLAEVLNRQGLTAHQQGDYSEARKQFEDSLTIWRSANGNQSEIATLLANLGDLEDSAGDYTRARTLHETSLQLHRKSGNRSGIANSLLSLGNGDYLRGDYARARELYAECLAVKKDLGEDFDVAISLMNLGLVASAQGDYAAARNLYNESLMIRNRLGDRSGIGELLGHLGLVAESEGDYTGARDLMEQSLNVRRELGDRRGIAVILGNLGILATEQGDYLKAHKLFHDSLIIRQEMGDRSGIACMLGNLGLLLQLQGDLTGATKLYKDSLAIRKDLRDRPGVALMLNNLGEISRMQDDHLGARKLFEESLIISKDTGNRPSIARTLMNLGSVDIAQGDYAGARGRYDESLAIHRSSGNRVGLAQVLSNLGALAANQGDYARARKLLEDGLAIDRELGLRSGIALGLANLGTVSAREGDHEGARKLLEESLSIARELGNRREVTRILGNLGMVAVSQGDWGAARSYFQEHLVLIRQFGKPLEIAESLLPLGDLAADEGDLAVAERFFSESRQLAAPSGPNSWALGHALFGLGRIATRLGRKAEARQLLDQAVQILRAIGNPELDEAQRHRNRLGSAPDPVECRKTCQEWQAKGDLAVPLAECVQKRCAD